MIENGNVRSFQSVRFVDASGSETEAAKRYISEIAKLRMAALKAAATGRSAAPSSATSSSPSTVVDLRDKVINAWRRIKRMDETKPDGRIALSDRFERELVHQHWDGETEIRSGGSSDGQIDFGTRLDVSSDTGTYWDLWFRSTGKGSIPKLTTYENATTQKFGGFARGENFDPDDDDDLYAHAESGFHWRYTPTKNCKLKLNAAVVQTYNRMKRTLINEPYAVSNCSISQSNYLTAGFFFDDFSSYGKSSRDVGPKSDYAGNGDDSSWSYPDQDVLSRSNDQTLNLSFPLDVPVFEGQPVTIFLGARSQLNANLNDVKADIWQGGTWRIIDVSILEV